MLAALTLIPFSRTFTSLTTKASTAVFNWNGCRMSKPLRSIFRVTHSWLKRWTILTPSYIRVLVIDHADNLLTEATKSPRNSFFFLSPPRFRLFPANHRETDYQDHLPSRPNNTGTINQVCISIYPNFTTAVLCSLGGHIPWAEPDKQPLHLFHSLIPYRSKASRKVSFIK